ncbi:hypothetical protein COCOBI_19-1740 [Coccomyxa sp. Obi]|nr:hypothetical protein COCOBI_19-1740 [Coccomyxa sp. Obi]
MPLACLETFQGTPSLEPPSSGRNAISGATAPLSSAHNADLSSPGNIQTIAGDQPCDTSCTTTLSPAPGRPAGDISPPPHPTAADVPTLSFKPPSWSEAQCTEPHSTGVLQGTTAICVKAATPLPGPVPDRSTELPNTPRQQAVLPRVPPAMKGCPPPQPTASDAPAVPLNPPSWAEPQSTSEAQRAAGICVPAGMVAMPLQGPVRPPGAAEPPNTPLQQTLLPRVPPAPKANGFAQRSKAKVASTGANYTGLLAQKAALERELVTLLNHHERLSRGLPWRMQHEEVSFMASIARCMAAGRPGTLPTISESVLKPSENLFQKLMLDPCATMNDVYQAAGIGLAFPEGCEPPLGPAHSDTAPEKVGTEGPVWSSVVTFLKLSMPQKDKLAAAYDAHMERSAAVRRECLAIGTKLQAEIVLKPSLAMHLACAHLMGIAKEDNDLMLILNKECYEVLNQVQMDNLLALAPAASAAVLGLCREIAATHGASAAKTAASPIEMGEEAETPLTERHQSATRPLDASVHALAGANNATGDAHGSADVTVDIITDATAVATDASGAASAPRNASAQASRPKQATGTGTQTGTLAQMIHACAPPSRRRKRQTPDSSWNFEGRPASKAQSSAGMPDAETPSLRVP